MRHLVIGGARSGKSRFAQDLALAHSGEVCLIVTAEVLDAEMAERVAKHRAERPANWRVVEAPLALPAAIRSEAQAGACVLVDCLTLWLSNILCTQPDTLPAQLEDLSAAVASAQGTLLMVSNEVGWSIVPENKLARLFRDEQGRLNQQLARLCDKVTLVAAGLPLHLKTGAAR
ncbi:bifunctional adenosylcobinamide kinase/adenosylcobinamide-phosphate guanylyltransferase [Uliginosibacterium sediminicola]|uniref:Bifunctional adenosylcobalamin biosynthesis protein n=1 Tax=Uliginosibacterium sediminicola TaxID=2024550 RepID=A0ABU9YX97_9RHOO